MKLLITGGAGFIGSNFIRYYLSKYKNCSITNLDKLTYAGNLDNLKDIEKDNRYNFVRGDICNLKLVEKLMKDVDVVVHFAAETHVDKSIMEAGEFVKTDIYGTFSMLNAAKKCDIKKFIHISTDEIYGSIEKGSFTEKSTLMPRNPYSASKAGADRLAYSFYTTYNLPVIITRSSNNFGYYHHPEKLIPLFTTNAIDNIPLPLYGDGSNKRDWMFVLDNCEAIDHVMQYGSIGEVYNIGAGNEKNNLEITKFILRELNKPESLVQYVKDRPGHDRRYALDIAKIRKLGWKPRYSFQSAMKLTVKWYVQNQEWWRKIKESRHFTDYYKTQYIKRNSRHQ